MSSPSLPAVATSTGLPSRLRTRFKGSSRSTRQPIGARGRPPRNAIASAKPQIDARLSPPQSVYAKCMRRPGLNASSQWEKEKRHSLDADLETALAATMRRGFIFEVTINATSSQSRPSRARSEKRRHWRSFCFAQETTRNATHTMPSQAIDCRAKKAKITPEFGEHEDDAPREWRAEEE